MSFRKLVKGANLYFVRRVGQQIVLSFEGKKAILTIAEFDGKSAVRVAIEAPKEIKILRGELLEDISQ